MSDVSLKRSFNFTLSVFQEILLLDLLYGEQWKLKGNIEAIKTNPNLAPKTMEKKSYIEAMEKKIKDIDVMVSQILKAFDTSFWESTEIKKS